MLVFKRCDESMTQVECWMLKFDVIFVRNINFFAHLLFNFTTIQDQWNCQMGSIFLKVQQNGVSIKIVLILQSNGTTRFGGQNLFFSYLERTNENSVTKKREMLKEQSFIRVKLLTEPKTLEFYNQSHHLHYKPLSS